MAPDDLSIEERKQLEKQLASIDVQIRGIRIELTEMVECIRGFTTAKRALAAFEAKRQALVDRLEGSETPDKTLAEKLADLQQQLAIANELFEPLLREICKASPTLQLPSQRPLVYDLQHIDGEWVLNSKLLEG